MKLVMNRRHFNKLICKIRQPNQEYTESTMSSGSVGDSSLHELTKTYILEDQEYDDDSLFVDDYL
jgi:hypothetical protein